MLPYNVTDTNAEKCISLMSRWLPLNGSKIKSMIARSFILFYSVKLRPLSFASSLYMLMMTALGHSAKHGGTVKWPKRSKEVNQSLWHRFNNLISKNGLLTSIALFSLGCTSFFG